MKIGFLSDIHEDVSSLHKALALLEKEKVDSIVCLGDIVGFALPFYKNITERDADTCIKLVKENCSDCVIGNHDLYAIKKTPTFNSGFNYQENWYLLDYDKRAKLARNKVWLYEDSEIPSILSNESKEYLNGLDEFKALLVDKTNIFISHFCFPDFSGSSIFFPEQPFHLKKHFEFTQNHNCSFSFSGHGHPEGCIYIDDEKLSLLKFGEHLLTNNKCWIVAPCVANTSRKNGVLIFDSTDKSINILELIDN